MLGLSGFETGVSTMPSIEAEGREQKIRNTGKLLATVSQRVGGNASATGETSVRPPTCEPVPSVAQS